MKRSLKVEGRGALTPPSIIVHEKTGEGGKS